jgi:hypothetical protein
MSTDLPLPTLNSGQFQKSVCGNPVGRPRGGGRGDAPSVMPVDRLYLQARSSVSDVFSLHPIALNP